jgi:hypothetical protein
MRNEKEEEGGRKKGVPNLCTFQAGGVTPSFFRPENPAC